MNTLILALAVLTGTIQGPTGLPVPGATVMVAGGSPVSSGYDGKFTLEVGSLPVVIEVSAPGFVTARVRVTASPVVISLSPLAVTESVVVFGGAPASWRDTATGTTSLSREDLDRIPAMTPDESLRVVSGFSLFRRSSSRASNPTTHGVTMRGLSASGASRALILVDGVPLNEGFGGWTTWARVPGIAISDVSVQRGPAGDAFGTDALGGVIRLGTRSSSLTNAAASVEIGSLDTYNVAVSGGRMAGRASFFGAASWFDTEGFIPLEPASRGAVDAPSDTTWTNAYARMTFGASNRRFTVSGWGGRDRRGNGTFVQRNHSRGATGTAAFEGVFGATMLTARGSHSPNWYEQTFTAFTAGRATERLTSTQEIDTTVSRAIVEAARAIPRGQAAVRASFSRGRSDFEDVRPTTTLTLPLRDDNRSLSGQIAVAPVTSLSLTAGARYEWRDAPLDTSDTRTAAVGRANAVWRGKHGISVRAAAATSHRWPTLNELARDFSAGTTTTLANNALLPERARSFEGGVGVEAPRYLLTATAFTAVVEDAIANVTQSIVGANITRKRQNAGEAHSKGVEIDAELKPIDALRLRGSATFVSAHFRNSQETALEGNWLPQVPKTSLAFEADALLPRRFIASLIVHNAAKQFDDDRNVFELASATQTDLRLAGAWREFGFQFIVENIADARLEVGRTPLVTLAQGRAFRVGLSWKK